MIDRDIGVRIGIPPRNYHNEKRFGFNIDGIEWKIIKRVPFYNGITTRVLPSRYSKILNAVSLYYDKSGIDGIHTFNSIVLNDSSPWIVSSERYVPTWVKPHRTKWIADWLFSRLGSENCRAILSSSENAKKNLIDMYSYHPSINEVSKKTKVVYPAIRKSALPNKRNKNKFEKKLKILFVDAGDFLKKGGDLVIDAFSHLESEYFNLTMVTEFECWSGGRFTFEERSPRNTDVKYLRRKAQSMDVEVKDTMPYDEVRKLMGENDILVFPSLEETFGFVVPEAMAEGTVPITLGIRAMPEIINDGESGFLIDVPTERDGSLDRESVSPEKIIKSIVSVLRYARENPKTVKKMARQATKEFEKKFSRDVISEDLKSVYENCF